MAKRKSHHATEASGSIRSRIERSLREGRSIQALDLAKNLFRQEPTPENRELLKQAYLARGRELRERGATRESVTTLTAAAASQGDDPAWLAEVAHELMLSGGGREAVALLPRLTDPTHRELVTGYAADSALQQGPTGRAILPEAFHADFDRTVQAFALSEFGNDEGAREVLGGIGLRSPFLEWKLLLRGLMAYYANDDARALENWQRLNPQRLPALLVAPLRQLIDAPYRTAQPPETQARLRQQLDKLQGSSLASRMRGLRAALADKENLAPAFRQAEALLPELRRTEPALAERLARVFYWAVTESSPDDLPRYQRVFGRPPGDPQFNRLHALAYDRGGDFEKAHSYWLKYEHEIAADPSRFPDGQATRARALIWLHMGQNAAHAPGEEEYDRIPWFVRGLAGPPRAIKPSAEKCYQTACELAPDLLEPYEALVQYYLEREKDKKAEQAARKLLKHFPEHVPTLEGLAKICAKKDDQDAALALYERALRANPLDRELREDVATAHLACARLRAVEKEFDLARRQIEAALALRGGTPDLQHLCRSAAVELKAGEDARAEELLTQARQLASGTTVSYVMMCEAARLKLPPRDKKRFEGEFAAGLAAPPSTEAAAELAEEAAAISLAPEYTGRKTHEKKAMTYLEKARRENFTREQLHLICDSLLRMGSIRLVRWYLGPAQEKFPKDPHFPYFMAISYYLQKEPEDLPAWKVRLLLEKAEKLARKGPQTDDVKVMLEDIGERLKDLGAYDPFSVIGGMFGRGTFDFGPGDDFDGDDDFED